MADNIAVTPGSGSIVAADELTYSGDTAKVQVVKLVTVSGAEGSKTATDVPFNANGQATMANSTPVAIASNQSAIPITDNSGSLTVDAPVGTPVFVRLSDGSSAITTLPVSLAALPSASLGSKAPAASLSTIGSGLEYEAVAASATDQVLGATGGTGDYLSHIVIQPATTGAGTVTVKDNTTVIFTFTTGTLADLRPITIPFGAFSASGAWKVTTGANVAVLAFGDFAA